MLFLTTLGIITTHFLAMATDTVFIGSSDFYFTKPNQPLTVKVPSRPHAGIIWAMVAHNASETQIASAYGKFVLDDKNKGNGHQEFNFSCKDCVKGKQYLTYFVLRRPWKEIPSEIRKIYFSIQ